MNPVKKSIVLYTALSANMIASLYLEDKQGGGLN